MRDGSGQASNRATRDRQAAAPDLRATPERGDLLLPAEEIVRALGQSLAEALDLARWQDSGDLETLLRGIDNAVGGSVGEERRIAEAVRASVFPRLRELHGAPDSAGLYAPGDRLLRDARRNVLLAGNLTAVDGACTGHDGLAALLVCVGVGLVRYDGRLSSWRTTFLRRDYNVNPGDLLGDVRDLLDRRAARSREGPTARRDQLSSLLRRGVMAAAERKALLEQANTRWRMGHGTPAPLELMTGSGSMDLIDQALPVLEGLLLGETRWVFLPDLLADRALLTMAEALAPGELAVFQKARFGLEEMTRRSTYDAEHRPKVKEFASRAGEAMVIGGFRATAYAPARLFVAHAERAVEAGILAMADAALQPHEGWPLILEIASLTAESGLGVDAFSGLVEAAYARARESGLYQPGRSH